MSCTRINNPQVPKRNQCAMHVEDSEIMPRTPSQPQLQSRSFVASCSLNALAIASQNCLFYVHTRQRPPSPPQNPPIAQSSRIPHDIGPLSQSVFSGVIVPPIGGGCRVGPVPRILGAAVVVVGVDWWWDQNAPMVFVHL